MTIRSRLLTLPLIACCVMPLTADSRLPDRRPPCVDCATDPGQLRVVRVKIYNQTRMSEANLDRVLEIANGIWLPYGVSFERATSADAIIIVMSKDPTSAATSLGPTVLGDTLFSRGHATPFIRLWPGAAEALVGGANYEGKPLRAWPDATRDAILLRVMGVALAHELGHYLLDTAHHSSGGLLKATLSVRELEYPDPARLWLTVEHQRLLCLGADEAD